jgi:hypothetical protein
MAARSIGCLPGKRYGAPKSAAPIHPFQDERKGL